MEVPAFQIVGAAIVGGIVQALKPAGLPTRFAPLAALAIGVVLGLFWALAVASETSAGVGVAAGLISGLTASGLYSGQKAVRGE